MTDAAAVFPARFRQLTEITRAIVRDFFDQQLLGRSSKLLAGKPVYPEVTVRTIKPAR